MFEGGGNFYRLSIRKVYSKVRMQEGGIIDCSLKRMIRLYVRDD